MSIKKNMKKRMMMVLAMTIAVLVAGPVMAACQAQEEATKAQQDTTNQDATTASSSTVGLGAFTTISAWGSNTDGQLGVDPYVDGTYVGPRSTPVEVSDLLEGGDLKALAAGGYHSLALKDDGTVLAWGDNRDGQLGDGTNTSSSTPVEVKDPSDPSGYMSGVKAIAAGSSHSLALKEDGTVWAWGSNTGSQEKIRGQLGNGTYTSSNTPVQVSDLDGVKAIAAGALYSLALKDDGTVWAWGYNRAGQGERIGGQLGDDTISSSNTPVQVRDLPDGLEDIAAGAYHGLALKDDGSVWDWGDNQSGQLGDGTNTSSSKPVQVSNLDGVKSVAAHGLYSLALKDDGSVWAWGNNLFGQLGDGSTTDGTVTRCEITHGRGGRTSSSCTDSNTPVQVSGVSGIEAIAAGSSHGLALKDDGTVWAWGDNQSGQLGNGARWNTSPSIGTNTPVQVSDLSGVKAIAAGREYSLAGW